MNDEIKEILENVKKCCDVTKDQSFTVYQREDILKLLDYITNLQNKIETYELFDNQKITKLQEEIERLNKSLEEQRHFYLDQLQQKDNIITKYKLIIKALYQHYHEHEYYELYEFLKQLESCTENDMNWLKKMAGENDE